jgi:hypothetical protein
MHFQFSPRNGRDARSKSSRGAVGLNMLKSREFFGYFRSCCAQRSRVRYKWLRAPATNSIERAIVSLRPGSFPFSHPTSMSWAMWPSIPMS